MKFLLAILAISTFSFLNTSYAQPLEEITATALEFEDGVADVQLTWNHDDDAAIYGIGCVSCFPNWVEDTTNDEITLQNITPLKNGSALLYIIAYDEKDEIINAKQVILRLQ